MIDIAEEQKLIEISRRYNEDLKALFGKYKLIFSYKVKIHGRSFKVVYLYSTKKYRRDLTVSYGHKSHDNKCIFINLVRTMGHWVKTDLTSFYLPTELSFTYLHERLHTILDNKEFCHREFKDDYEKDRLIKNFERHLRRYLEYVAIPME